MHVGEVFINPEIEKNDAREHVVAAESWLNACERVAKQTNNEYASSLISTFVENAAVCKPAVQGFTPIQGPEVPSIFIIPILSGEENLNETTKELTIVKSQGARFTENIPGRIYFDGTMEMSELWKGLILLHELNHADNYTGSKYPSDHSEHWEEEVDVFMFEHQLLGIIGGDAYKTYANRQLGRLLDEYKKSGQRIIPPITDLDLLDTILVKSLSNDEVKARTSVVFMDIVFKMFDEMYPSNARKEKASFLQNS